MLVGDFRLGTAEIARSRGVVVGEVDDESAFDGRVREDKIRLESFVDLMEEALDLMCWDENEGLAGVEEGWGVEVVAG